jgi:hypothetical protein
VGGWDWGETECRGGSQGKMKEVEIRDKRSKKKYSKNTKPR